MPTSINTWFISDTHFSHPAILSFHEGRRKAVGLTEEEVQSDREGALKKHDEWLIDLWNSTVRREDFIYILGDFCLGNKVQTEKILNKLKGRKFLIEGNHDKSLKGLERYFLHTSQIKEMKFTNNQYDFIDPNETFCVEMCHFPLLTWNRRPHGTCCLMGHCHGALDNFNTESKELRVDVGLDGNLANYKLISIEKLYKHFIDIRDAAGCKTFQEYNEWLMQKQGIRL